MFKKYIIDRIKPKKNIRYITCDLNDKNHQIKQSSDICMIAVSQDGLRLRDVSPCFYSQELFTTAIKQNGFALAYVPDSLKTEKLCTLALEQNIHAIEFVPKIYKNNFSTN